jgi:hypothetical protein
MLQIVFNEKIKILKKGPLVVESFVTIGSFECDFTQKIKKCSIFTLPKKLIGDYNFWSPIVIFHHEVACYTFKP